MGRIGILLIALSLLGSIRDAGTFIDLSLKIALVGSNWANFAMFNPF